MLFFFYFFALYLCIFDIYTLLYLFICFWLRWVFVAVLGLSLVLASGGCSLVAMHGLLLAVASLLVEHGL